MIDVEESEGTSLTPRSEAGRHIGIDRAFMLPASAS